MIWINWSPLVRIRDWEARSNSLWLSTSLNWRSSTVLIRSRRRESWRSCPVLWRRRKRSSSPSPRNWRRTTWLLISSTSVSSEKITSPSCRNSSRPSRRATTACSSTSFQGNPITINSSRHSPTVHNRVRNVHTNKRLPSWAFTTPRSSQPCSPIESVRRVRWNRSQHRPWTRHGDENESWRGKPTIGTSTSAASLTVVVSACCSAGTSLLISDDWGTTSTEYVAKGWCNDRWWNRWRGVASTCLRIELEGWLRWKGRTPGEESGR